MRKGAQVSAIRSQKPRALSLTVACARAAILPRRRDRESHAEAGHGAAMRASVGVQKQLGRDRRYTDRVDY